LTGFRRIDAFQADTCAVDDKGVAIDDLGHAVQSSLAAFGLTAVAAGPDDPGPANQEPKRQRERHRPSSCVYGT
jgi:hypothetical protein